MRLAILMEGRKVDELNLGMCTPKNDDNDHYQILENTRVHGRYRVSRYELFKIIVIELQSENTCSLELTYYESYAEMSFVLEGKISCWFNNSEEGLHAESPSHNIYYATKGSRKIDPRSENLKLMIIQYSPPHFLEYLTETPRFSDFRTSIKRDQPGFLYPGFEGLNANMKQLIHELECCSSDCPFKCIHIKIKVLELLLNQFENSPIRETSPSELSECENQKICKAKAIVEANFTAPPGLSELARQVGSNEFYLKKGFKTITGNTVYGYIQDLKMKKAVELLKENDTTIQQVAEAVGYKYAQHFSTAFKKNYGMSPGKYKKLHL